MADCPEIQHGHKWETGDYSANGSPHIYCGLCHSEFGWNEPSEEEIFLPRQDQLQDMLDIGSYKDIRNTHVLWLIDIPEADTWEKAWLIFIMKELHNKTWDGKWILQK